MNKANKIIILALIFIGLSNVAFAQKQNNSKYNLDKVFRFLDKNNDKKISKKEASNAKEITKNFAYLDTNNDGFLTIEELKRTHSSNENKYTYLENDGIFMYYETQEKEIYRKLLPEVFDMPNRLLVYTFISDFYKMKGQTEPYKEASIFLLAKYKGKEVWHCVYMPVTSEESMRMGIVRLGLPKTMGKIEFSRSEPTYNASLVDKYNNSMSLNIDTKEYSFSKNQEKTLKELSLIPKMNILNGKVIKMSKKGNENGGNRSILDVAKQMPNLVTTKEGKGNIDFNISSKSKNNSVNPLELKPSKIIGTYYMYNTIPFSLSGKSF